MKVESHRFGTEDLHTALTHGAFSLDVVASKAAEWKSAGVDLSAALAALGETNANVSYEQLECLGLDESYPERLVATFRIKRPFGYSGNLCQAGSTEYVAFWADWDNTCEWTYQGTVAVNVHDFATIPKDGLCYTAIQPVDLTYHRRPCGKPKIGRVRAVLSWAIPPSKTNPNLLNYWGNRLDTHVQINPGDVIDPNHPLAALRVVGGIAIEDIDTAFSGMTNTSASGGGPVFFAHHTLSPADAWGLNRQCPFGGEIIVEGDYYFGYYYRIMVQKVGVPLSQTDVYTSFNVLRVGPGFDTQVAGPGGWFKYLNPLLEWDRTLAYWEAAGLGDDEWELWLEISTTPSSAGWVASSPHYRIQLDNTAPEGPPASPLTMDIVITSGSGDCTDVTVGDTVTGNFIAYDLHFGAWALSTEPNTLTTPSNQPVSTPLLSPNAAAPAPGGHNWSLNTNSPIAMKPCGYVVRLDVWDRTIVNSVPGEHNSNNIEVGFCLRAKS